MNKKSVLFFCLFIFCLSLINSVFAESHYRYIYDLKTDVYFGHISFTETQLDGKDPIVLREGKRVPEVAVLNFPIAPGDTVITPRDRKCEIQFDTGTIIRLDTNTEIKIETILAKSLTSPSKLTNFVLKRGQIYVMYKQYSSSEILQILFSNASAKFKHKSVLLMRANMDGSTDVKVDRGQVSMLYGPDDLHLEKTVLNRFDEATISVHNQIQFSEYENAVDFSLWNFEMNKNFLALHKGISDLPKPIQRLSPAVFNFAQKFSNLFGDWQWNDIYGYVWRPFTNDRYPSGDWQPYSFGQWRKINEDLFWIPEEIWGWVPYHLGVWTWDKKAGWLWIPGGAFAPSWATWNYYSGYFSWRPITLFDWLFNGIMYSYIPQNYSDGVFGSERFNGDNQIYTGSSIKKSTLNKINKNQLKNNSAAAGTIPKGMRKILANMEKALKRGDTRIFESLKEVPKPTLVVNGDQLSSSSIQKSMMEMDQMSAIIQGGLSVRNPSVDPLGYARLAIRKNEFIATLAQNMVITRPDFSGGAVIQSRTIQPSIRNSEGSKDTVKRPLSSKLKQSSSRFRDWNPDVKVANRLGVSIKYSSLENAVRVPELEGTSGGGRRGEFNLSRGGSSRISSTSSGGSTSSSSSSGSSSSSRSSSSSSSRSRSSSSSSSKSSGSKTIKKI